MATIKEYNRGPIRDIGDVNTTVDDITDKLKELTRAANLSGGGAVAWSLVEGTPTTLAGFGITDGASEAFAQDVAAQASATRVLRVGDDYHQGYNIQPTALVAPLAIPLNYRMTVFGDTFDVESELDVSGEFEMVGALGAEGVTPGYVADAVAAEAALRAAADSTEAAARAAADSAESAARIAGDNAEAASRASGDTATLATAEAYTDTQVASEASARASADTALTGSLNTEITNRSNDVRARGLPTVVSTFDRDTTLWGGGTPSAGAKVDFVGAGIQRYNTVSGLWELKYPEGGGSLVGSKEINLLNYGAVDQTDQIMGKVAFVGADTLANMDALQSAINACEPGNTIYIPAGGYAFVDKANTGHANGAPYVITKPINFRGDGPRSALWIQSNDLRTPFIQVGAPHDPASTLAGLYWRDFAILGGFCNIGLGIFQCHNSQFRRLHLSPGSVPSYRDGNSRGSSTFGGDAALLYAQVNGKTVRYGGHCAVVGACLGSDFEFICSQLYNRETYSGGAYHDGQVGYWAGATGGGGWEGAAVRVMDVRRHPDYTAAFGVVATNRCTFKIIAEAGTTTGGLWVDATIAGEGGNNTYQQCMFQGMKNTLGSYYVHETHSYVPGSSPALGAGYGFYLEGGKNWKFRDTHIEDCGYGMVIEDFNGTDKQGVNWATATHPVGAQANYHGTIEGIEVYTCVTESVTFRASAANAIDQLSATNVYSPNTPNRILVNVTEPGNVSTRDCEWMIAGVLTKRHNY